MAIKLPSGHGDLLSAHCGDGPELGARRSGCARNGNQHVMQHREGGGQSGLWQQVWQQPTASKVIAHFLFLFSI